MPVSLSGILRASPFMVISSRRGLIPEMHPTVINAHAKSFKLQFYIPMCCLLLICIVTIKGIFFVRVWCTCVSKYIVACHRGLRQKPPQPAPADCTAEMIEKNFFLNKMYLILFSMVYFQRLQSKEESDKHSSGHQGSSHHPPGAPPPHVPRPHHNNTHPHHQSELLLNGPSSLDRKHSGSTAPNQDYHSRQSEVSRIFCHSGFFSTNYHIFGRAWIFNFNLKDIN